MQRCACWEEKAAVASGRERSGVSLCCCFFSFSFPSTRSDGHETERLDLAFSVRQARLSSCMVPRHVAGRDSSGDLR